MEEVANDEDDEDDEEEDVKVVVAVEEVAQDEDGNGDVVVVVVALDEVAQAEESGDEDVVMVVVVVLGLLSRVNGSGPPIYIFSFRYVSDMRYLKSILMKLIINIPHQKTTGQVSAE